MTGYFYHMKYGKQSGIRLCCRLFFSLLWVHGRMYWWKWRYQDLYGGTDNYDYIPCPLCIMAKGRRIKLIEDSTCQ
jgi:hypothetical protein